MYIMQSFGKSDKQLLEVEFRIHGLNKYNLNPNILSQITNNFINCYVNVLSIFIWRCVVIIKFFVLSKSRNLATLMKNIFTLTTLIKMQRTHY